MLLLCKLSGIHKQTLQILIMCVFEPMHGEYQQQQDQNAFSVRWGIIQGWKQDWPTDSRIRKACAILREVYGCFFTKCEYSNTANLLDFKWVFLPIPTFEHEICVIICRIMF